MFPVEIFIVQSMSINGKIKIFNEENAEKALNLWVEGFYRL